MENKEPGWITKFRSWHKWQTIAIVGLFLLILFEDWARVSVQEIIRKEFNAKHIAIREEIKNELKELQESIMPSALVGRKTNAKK